MGYPMSFPRWSEWTHADFRGISKTWQLPLTHPFVHTCTHRHTHYSLLWTYMEINHLAPRVASMPHNICEKNKISLQDIFCFLFMSSIFKVFQDTVGDTSEILWFLQFSSEDKCYCFSVCQLIHKHI